MDVHIQTDRLRIAPFEMGRLEAYFSGFDEEVARYQYPEPFASMAAAEEALRGFISLMERNEMLFLSILALDGEFIGGAEVHGLREPYPELGVWIKREKRRQGYAFEALRAVLQMTDALYHKEWYVYEADIRNQGSMKLVEKFEHQAKETDEFDTESGKHLILRKFLIRNRGRKGAGYG